MAAHLEAEALHRGRLADDPDILQAADVAVSTAESAKADLVLVRALQVRAEVAGESGNVRDAEAAGARAQVVAEESANEECKALASVTGGYCLLVAGHYERGAEAFARAAPILANLGLLVELRRVLNGLGICYTASARLREAVRCLGNAIHVARELGDSVAACNVWNNLGSAYHEAGYFAEARRSYQEALDLLPLIPRVATPAYANTSGLALEAGRLMDAARYTDDGGRVIVRLRTEGEWVRCAIENTGSSITADELPYIWERLYRVDRSRSRETGGTGLGLAIVKHVLNRHQGRLEIVSEPGRGSTFTARFPAPRLLAPEQRAAAVNDG